MDLEQLEREGAEDLGGQGGDAASSDKGRFLLESKPAVGMILLKGKRVAYREWLERRDGNGFLKRAQKSGRCKEMLVDRIGQLYSLLMAEEEARARHEADMRDLEEKIGSLHRKNAYIQVCKHG